MLRIRGFVRWLVVQLLASSKPKPKEKATSSGTGAGAGGGGGGGGNSSMPPPSDAQQVLLDLTGELIKFNHQVCSCRKFTPALPTSPNGSRLLPTTSTRTNTRCWWLPTNDSQRLRARELTPQ